MTLDPKEIDEILLITGLSKYESKCYRIIVGHQKIPITDIIDRFNIPKTQAYKAVKSLEEKKWIYSLDGRPKQYAAYQPTKLLQQSRYELLEKMQKVEAHLEISFENRVIDDTDPLRIIHGFTEIQRLTKLSLIRAKKSVTLLLRFISSEEATGMFKQLQTMKSKGNDVFLALHSDILSSLDQKEIESLLSITERKTVQDLEFIPIPVRVLFIDHSYMVISMRQLISSSPDTYRYFSVEINISEVAELMEQALRITIEQMKRNTVF